jgi:hypothetical protein
MTGGRSELAAGLSEWTASVVVGMFPLRQQHGSDAVSMEDRVELLVVDPGRIFPNWRRVRHNDDEGAEQERSDD